MRPALLALAVACLLAATGMSFAHHGTSTYDMNKEATLTGTVKQWTFDNPHSWLWLDVTTPEGRVEEWSIESAPPSYLSRQGWSASTLKAREKITILMSPLRAEPRRGILLEVKRSGGETLIVRPRGSFGRPARVN
jgi:hypothetical protein